MNDSQQIIAASTLLGAIALWLMLPRGAARGRGIGGVIGLAALGLWLSRLEGLGDWVSNSLFLILAVVTVVAAAATITFRNPVYCAIWFGMTLTGTAGLFLVSGAEFLAVATLIVYAGAILVTFLFVLMLAQPEGHTPYDRLSWEPMLAAATGAVIVGVLTMTVSRVLTEPQPGLPLTAPSAEALTGRILAPQHVAWLGTELFGRHLVAIEVAGVLLLAALVGAAVIIAQGRIPKKPE